MARSRKSIPSKEWLSLFDKSLHNNTYPEENEVKRNRNETETSTNKPAASKKQKQKRTAPTVAPAFVVATQGKVPHNQEVDASALLNLATMAEAKASAEKAVEDARIAALTAQRDKLKAECLAQMQAALNEKRYKESLHRIETMDNFECDLISDVIESATPNTHSFFKLATSTPLQLAAYDGDLKKVNELLSDPSIYVDSCYGSGLSPLWLAAYCNHIEIAKVLLNHGADYDLICVRNNKEVGTPYEVATRNKATAMIEVIHAHERKLFESYNTIDL